jgi:hypothetical protein
MVGSGSENTGCRTCGISAFHEECGCCDPFHDSVSLYEASNSGSLQSLKRSPPPERANIPNFFHAAWRRAEGSAIAGCLRNA